MTEDSVTVTILKDIRTELRSHGEELRAHGQQLRAHSEELRELREGQKQLEKRQFETEVRLATELTAVVGAIHELRDVIVEDRKLRADVADHELRIRKLEARPKGSDRK